MNFAGHVELEEWNGQPLLTVRDYELRDFLEDHFMDLAMETAQVNPAGAIARYQLLFPLGISKANVWRVLDAIGAEQIERIVAINSGAGSTGRDA